VAQRIRESTGAEVQLEIADLSRMGDVDALVRRLLRQGEPLDVLINNAGALYNARRETAEGVEMSFATLLLSPFVLTEALHPLLKAARGSRVINVSSGGMYTQRVHLDDLEFARGRFDGAKAYARAKRGLVDLAEVWARQWASEGIVVHSMHPGWADTPGVVESLPSFHRWTRPLLRTAEEAAEGLTWLAASAQVAESTGLFWLDCLPRTTAVFPGTRSSLGTQRKMVAALAGYAHRLLPGADYLSHTLQGVSSFSS
jgi:NAD(P)-dependent dehydrogenase (short-subunit alcohol dehydrogenase family)